VVTQQRHYLIVLLLSSIIYTSTTIITLPCCADGYKCCCPSMACHWCCRCCLCLCWEQLAFLHSPCCQLLNHMLGQLPAVEVC
jgi:hypothetical protein